MERSAHKEKFLAFLQTIARPDRPLDTVAEDDGLTRSGVIDSLAMLEIIGYLEREYGIDFSIRGVNPGDLSSIARVLDLIERETAK